MDTIQSSKNASESNPMQLSPDELRARYAQERDKRLRSDGGKQFIEPKGDLSYLTADPFAPRFAERASLNDEVEVVIVGGGHCGLLAGVRLLEAGITNIRILDGASDFGGAWYWNRYPGLRCDVDSYIYLPLLEETGLIPKSKYASGPEIFENAQRIGKKFGLYEKTFFQTHVEESRWDDSTNLWTVKTDRGDSIKARFVVMALGPLNKPKLPGIPGISSFKGKLFHTSRWDYEYTGGDCMSDEPAMSKLVDKRVAIIGTGCTGVQCAPRVAKYAKHLSIIQRTPSAINARNNTPTDLNWFKALPPGWQQKRSENFDAVMQGLPADENLINDGWTDISSIFKVAWGAMADDSVSPEDAALLSEMMDFEKMNIVRTRVDTVVANKETADKLKAWYRLFCKRPTFSDHYLQMFNLSNVSLVDTDGKGVERITETGVVIGGVEHKVDCIILASGYEVGTDYCRRGGLQIYGRNGLSLSEYWSNHMKTLYGYMSSGFPNCFHMGVFLQNAAFGNFTAVYTRQAEKISGLISHVKSLKKQAIEPTSEAEDAWVKVIEQCQESTNGFFAQCTPGYYNGEGKPESGEGISYAQYTGGVSQFNAIVDDWVNKGLPGVVVS